MSYKISKSKIKYKFHSPYVEKVITKAEWFDIIENDESLTWLDDIERWKKLSENIDNKQLEKFHAIYEYNKSLDSGIMDLDFVESVLPVINCEIVSQRKKCMIKIFEIAEKLNAKVYKLGKEVVKK
jgi:hypothetical protein